jgi:hypothetical protein
MKYIISFVATIVLLLNTQCRQKANPITQMLGDLKNDHGVPNTIDSGSNNTVLYQYSFYGRDGNLKSAAIKNSINKSLNLLPVKENDKMQSIGNSIVMGEYKWEDPHFQVDMNTQIKSPDTIIVRLWVRN